MNLAYFLCTVCPETTMYFYLLSRIPCTLLKMSVTFCTSMFLPYSPFTFMCKWNPFTSEPLDRCLRVTLPSFESTTNMPSYWLTDMSTISVVLCLSTDCRGNGKVSMV